MHMYNGVLINKSTACVPVNDPVNSKVIPGDGDLSAYGR